MQKFLPVMPNSTLTPSQAPVVLLVIDLISYDESY